MGVAVMLKKWGANSAHCTLVFLRQRKSLPRAEAMLFVHYGEREMLEAHRLLHERMRADEYRYLAAFHPCEKLRAGDLRRTFFRHF